MPEEDYLHMLGRVLKEQLEAEARKKMPSTPRGMDDVPTHHSPMQRTDPFTPFISPRELSLSLPANKGAHFDAYMNYKIKPLKIDDSTLNGAGIRYRYDF